MRCFLSLLAASGALFGATSLFAVERGASYDDVLGEKGTPLGSLNAGSTQILKYSDQEIRLEGGVVTSIRAVQKSPAAPARMPSPTAKPRAPQAAPAAVSELRWTDSFPEAITMAKEQDRQVFMFFTGSDWCGWCKRLDDEVLSTPEFARYAAEKLVLLKVDFPKKVQQPDDLKAQNQALAKRFRVAGYPTVIVFSSTGKRLADLGYQPGGPEPFVNSLAALK